MGSESAKPLNQILSGNQAFYNQPDYLNVTKNELALKKCLNKVSYRYETESKIKRIAFDIFSVIIFPVGIARLLHRLAGRFVVLSSRTNTANIAQIRSKAALTTNWKFKRLTVEVNGTKIDAVILGKPETLGNGRWVLDSTGNAGYYEKKLPRLDMNFEKDFLLNLQILNANALIFNYTGVGASEGLVSRAGIVNVYRAMLKLLEDKKNGIGAKEIVGYGHSIGGGVQGEALKDYPLKKQIKYVFVKSRTFSEISKVVPRIIGFLVKIFGWNMSSVKSSLELKCPEIILQSVKGNSNTNDPNLVKGDGVISAEASLIKAIDSEFKKKKMLAGPKAFLGIPEKHNQSLHLHTIELLAQGIREALRDNDRIKPVNLNKPIAQTASIAA